VPQFEGSTFVSMHDPAHAVAPFAQLVEHAPFEQTSPALHALPHAPQFS
jgi:hypothetical protein